jgi:ABC-type nitrate/sulfonate/bicarbonate transport system permease component
VNGYFLANQNIPETDKFYIKCGWIALAVMVWMMSPFACIPTLQRVLAAFPLLLKEDFLVTEIMASMKLYGITLLVTIALSSVIAYATVIPVFKCCGDFAASLRAISPIGVLVLFTIAAPDGFWFKVYVLTFCIAPWFITAMIGVIEAIPHEKYEYARTLKLSRFMVVWHVVIRGELHNVIESFRQIATMGIVLLPVVERLARSDGGVGAILASLERFQRLDKIYAIDIVILCIVFGQDYLLRALRNTICPYAEKIEKGE